MGACTLCSSSCKDCVFHIVQEVGGRGNLGFKYLDVWMSFGQFQSPIWLQNYANVVVGKHKIQTFEIVVVVLLLLLLLFDVFVPTSAHPLLRLDKWSVQIHLNVSSNVYVEGLFTFPWCELHVWLPPLRERCTPIMSKFCFYFYFWYFYTIVGYLSFVRQDGMFV